MVADPAAAKQPTKMSTNLMSLNVASKVAASRTNTDVSGTPICAAARLADVE